MKKFFLFTISATLLLLNTDFSELRAINLPSLDKEETQVEKPLSPENQPQKTKKKWSWKFPNKKEQTEPTVTKDKQEKTKAIKKDAKKATPKKKNFRFAPIEFLKDRTFLGRFWIFNKKEKTEEEKLQPEYYVSKKLKQAKKKAVDKTSSSIRNIKNIKNIKAPKNKDEEKKTSILRAPIDKIKSIELHPPKSVKEAITMPITGATNRVKNVANTVSEKGAEVREDYRAHQKEERIKRKKLKDLKKQHEAILQSIKRMEEEEGFVFAKYNKNPGVNELDFYGIYGKRQISTKGVISPNYSKIAYTEVHFYPSVKQLTSTIYVLNLTHQKTVKRRILDAHIKNRSKIDFYQAGYKHVEEGFFRTLTIVDWSKDSSKLLVKERIAENLEGFLDTKVWVYDFETKKSYLVQNLKEKIRDYWKEEKGLSLNKYRWDISPLGWFGYQPDRIIVKVYGYAKDKSKIDMGTWLVGYKDGSALPLSDTNKKFPIQANGFILKKPSPYKSN